MTRRSSVVVAYCVPRRAGHQYLGTVGRDRVTDAVKATATLARAGLLRPVSPVALARGALAIARDGLSPAAMYEYNAARFPHETAVADDRGAVTFAEMAHDVSALAGALENAGVTSGDRVALMCRNHREFVGTTAAVAQLGADILFLNVSFAAPQLAQVLADEKATALVYDEAFSPVVMDAAPDVRRLVARRDDGSSPDAALDELGAGSRRPLRLPPRQRSRYVLLTSGTTGRPRGAGRPMPGSLDPLVAILSRIPLRVRDVVLIASPLFHGWGFANFAIGLGLSETVVLQERFEPEAALAAIARHGVRVLVAVPVMLQRLVELPEETRSRYDLSSLEIVAASGSALSEGLALEFMDAFGDVLYNLYGSTEAAWASIATPEDLRAAPASAGYPPAGTVLRVVDDDGEDVERGGTGRILVRNGQLLRGTADGSLGGFLDTGDLGHIDEAGRLFVEGRGDDMIVSGGENVQPREVEDLLGTHPDIKEAAVMGAPDPEFGQRLRALVVLRPGADLTADDVRGFVREHLARFKVPRDVEFVEELPRNETGKVLHRSPSG